MNHYRNLVPRRGPRERKGFALAMAIGSIVVIGTMIAGIFFVATQENRVGRNSLNQEKAFRAAEWGLNYTYGTWSSGAMSSLATGASVTRVYDSSASRGWADTVRITRLNGPTYWLVSTGTAGSGATASRHRTNLVIRIGYPNINVLGALTVRGAINIGGSSYIAGGDTTPSGWPSSDCPPPNNMPGIATPSRGNITTSGCTRLSCVDGTPDVRVTGASNDTSTYFVYGNDANWASLTAAASLTYTGNQNLNGLAPSVSGGICNTADDHNWGDPRRANPAGACEGYFPIVYFSGTTSVAHLTTGSGQGILLVDGDLIVDGGFEWYGPVIVRGHLTTQGSGGHFTGAVMAANVDLEQNVVLGDAIINYSSCAVTKALVGAGIAKRLAQRSWAELY